MEFTKQVPYAKTVSVKTNYVYNKHRSIFICVSKQRKINLKCIYF
jgi:hypothetical protein